MILKQVIDKKRVNQVSISLKIQCDVNAYLLCFQTFNKMPIPVSYELDYYNSLRFPFASLNKSLANVKK